MSLDIQGHARHAGPSQLPSPRREVEQALPSRVPVVWWGVLALIVVAGRGRWLSAARLQRKTPYLGAVGAFGCAWKQNPRLNEAKSGDCTQILVRRSAGPGPWPAGVTVSTHLISH